MPNLASFDTNSAQNRTVSAALPHVVAPATWVRLITTDDTTKLAATGGGANNANFQARGTLALLDQVNGQPPHHHNPQQIQNRYNNQASAHILLLDLQVQANQNPANLQQRTDMSGILTQEAAQTTFAHPAPVATPGGHNLNYQNDDVRWLIKNPGPTSIMLQHRGTALHDPNAPAFLRWNGLGAADQQALTDVLLPGGSNNLMVSVAQSQQYDQNARFGHHEHKSANRLSQHFTDLDARLNQNAAASGNPIPQYITEVRGEHLAAKTLLTYLPESHLYQLKLGFVPGGHHGIDQIWVKRSQATGAVEEYLIVEAKGSAGAHLGLPNIGEQMSPRWVFESLLAAADSGGAPPDRVQRLARKVLTAMFADVTTIRVWGLVLQGLYDPGAGIFVRDIRVTAYPVYNRPDLP